MPVFRFPEAGRRLPVGGVAEQCRPVAIGMREAVTPDGLFTSIDGEDLHVWGAVRFGGRPFHLHGHRRGEIVLTASRDHRLAERGSVDLLELDGEDLVHFAPDNGLSSWLDRSLSAAGLRLRPVLRTSVTPAAPQLAAAGLGIATTPVSAVSAGFPGLVRSFPPRGPASWSR